MDPLTPVASGMSDSANLTPRTVAVVGLGLIGGSLVRGLAGQPAPPRVLGVSPDAGDREGAERQPGVVAVADAADVVGEADVVVYATPMHVILDLLPVHARRFRDDALVTDVAGLKRPVLDAARQAGLAGRFVGSHPMAGGEATGFDGGRPDLFQDAQVWLCADPPLDPFRSARIEAFWRALGASPEWADPDVHDRLMVQVSHLPQLVSNALALALESAGVAPANLGPGGRDMTRLAASSPGVWADLIGYTTTDAAKLLRELGAQVEGLAARLEAGEVEAVAELMAQTRAWRTGPNDSKGRISQ